MSELQARLSIKSLKCENCSTEIIGNYPLPSISMLSPQEQSFVLRFVLNSGSLKEMSAELKLSYPTVRNILNDIIEKLNGYENEN